METVELALLAVAVGTLAAWPGEVRRTAAFGTVVGACAALLRGIVEPVTLDHRELDRLVTGIVGGWRASGRCWSAGRGPAVGGTAARPPGGARRRPRGTGPS